MCESPPPAAGWNEHRIELTIGRLLRGGVLLAAALVFIGAVIYLWHHGGERPNYSVFHGEPRQLRGIGGVLRDAARGNGRGLIQLGLLVLIATPVMRVAFAAYAFLRSHDRLYVGITLLVLAILLFSLFATG